MVVNLTSRGLTTTTALKGVKLIYDPGNGEYIVVDGNIVERDAYRIVERIHEYDENLSVIVLDPETANLSDAPFLVVELKPDGTYQRVIEAWQLDERILERLWAADQRKFDSLETLAKLEMKKKKDTEDRYREAIGDGLEMAVAALKSEKSTFSFENKEGDLITLKDDSPNKPSVNNSKKSF